ncbi:MAG: DNA-binding response regulator [Nitrosomonadales bacterium]|nr:MAG: DNA-binding response regulator [Nitrosomonadales bacterium]
MIDQADGATRVLLIGRYPIVLWGLEKLIDSQKPRMEMVGKFPHCAEALSQLEELSADVILLDRDLGIENAVDDIPRLTGLSKAKIMVLTGSRDPSAHVSAVLAGAKGVVEKEEGVETILRAIEKVHEGQLWLDRTSMGMLVIELSNRKVSEKRDPAQQRVGILTDREREIVATVTSHSGANGTVIAEMLHISESTLRKHLSSIYEKLGLSSRLELWDYAHKRGLNKD